jgi:hypothetical protein
MRHRNVTFVNVSPAPHTRPIVEAQGFARYSDGQFVAVPAFARAPGDVVFRLQDGDEAPKALCDPVELALMRAHGHVIIWTCEPVSPCGRS